MGRRREEEGRNGEEVDLAKRLAERARAEEEERVQRREKRKIARQERKERERKLKQEKWKKNAPLSFCMGQLCKLNSYQKSYKKKRKKMLITFLRKRKKNEHTSVRSGTIRSESSVRSSAVSEREFFLKKNNKKIDKSIS